MMSENEVFSIKETSEQAGLSEDTIRYYEKIGLLPELNARPIAIVYIARRISIR